MTRAFAVELTTGQEIPEPEALESVTLDQNNHGLERRQEQTDRTSLAVLPFESAREPEFADGLSNDLATDLGKFARFTVVAPHSAFAHKGQAATIQQMATDLGVDYVLEGRVQWAADRVRISVQLSDGATGQQVWAERYQREVEDVFELQDELVEIVSASVAHKLDSIEAKRSTTHDQMRISARDLYAKGREIFFSRTRESNLESKRLLGEAIDLDETLARAFGFLSWLHTHDCRYGWSEEPEQSLNMAVELALKALSLDPTDYESHWRLGVAYLHRREFDKALMEYGKAKDLNPNHAGFLSEMSGALILVGRAEDAVVQIEHAMKLNPSYPDHFVAHLGWAHYELGQLDESRKTLREMNDPPAVFLPIVVATYVRLGLLAEAKTVAAKLLEREPQFSARATHFGPYRDVAIGQRMVDELRLAGLPE